MTLRNVAEVLEFASVYNVSVTLRNVAEVLEFASLYNASQLKRTCQQYICLNLVALLESRALDILSDDVIDDLTRYYRTMVGVLH